MSDLSERLETSIAETLRAEHPSTARRLAFQIVDDIQQLIAASIKEALSDARVIGNQIWDGS